MPKNLSHRLVTTEKHTYTWFFFFCFCQNPDRKKPVRVGLDVGLDARPVHALVRERFPSPPFCKADGWLAERIVPFLGVVTWLRPYRSSLRILRHSACPMQVRSDMRDRNVIIHPYPYHPESVGETLTRAHVPKS